MIDSISGSLMNVHANGAGAIPSDNQLAEQLIGEVGLWSNSSMMFSLTGSFAHMDVVKSWELLPEFDWVLPKNDMFTGAIGGLAYLDRAVALGPSAGIYYARSMVLAQLGRHLDAASTCGDHSR